MRDDVDCVFEYRLIDDVRVFFAVPVCRLFPFCKLRLIENNSMFASRFLVVTLQDVELREHWRSDAVEIRQLCKGAALVRRDALFDRSLCRDDCVAAAI